MEGGKVVDFDSIVLGSRFEFSGHCGLVLYKGLVKSTEGLWLGVEWDDSARGKHNGTRDGIKYFSTSHPTAGSFIRPQKANFGICYCQAVRDRYAWNEDPNNSLYILTGKLEDKLKKVELEGMEKLRKKQSDFSRLEIICIPNMNVKGVEPSDPIEDFTPNVVELDLTGNLISSWDEVAKITKHQLHLSFLIVSENRLTLPINAAALEPAFKTLEQLAMNRMNYNWMEIIQCAQMWPSVKKLVVPFNNITYLTVPDPPIFQHLEYLDLESNQFSWADVLKLGHLPKLQGLNLNNTGIDNIQFSDVPFGGEKTSFFAALKSITLNNNNCSKWSDIAELNKLFSLTDISMRNNPILSTEKPDTIRQLIIAKIEHLDSLNFVKVTPEERHGAEIDYLKKYGTDWLAVTASLEHPTLENVPKDFLYEHPRFMEIVKKFGAPEESELKVQQTNLKSTLLVLHIYSPLLPHLQPFIKKIPGTMTVQKLRGLVKRLFKLDNQEFIVSYISSKCEGHATEYILESDARELTFYAIEDGDKILVKW